MHNLPPAALQRRAGMGHQALPNSPNHYNNLSCRFCCCIQYTNC